MASTRDELLAAALALPREERERMAHELLESLDDESEHLSPEQWEHAWTEELRRRVQEVKAGQAELIDADEVFRQAHADLDARRRR